MKNDLGEGVGARAHGKRLRRGRRGELRCDELVDVVPRSPALAAGVPELRRKRVDSEGDDDGNHEEDEREEIEERVGESLLATESQRDELRSSNGPPVESNSKTLAVVPSSVLQDRSAGKCYYFDFEWQSRK
ncbi:hypothetical protein SESBI_29395 [Sesbania bispinosa]|nr:hypothetical protein SESBI_29395 [Sesbania bispinosa]